jgi:hypothetical protein
VIFEKKITPQVTLASHTIGGFEVALHMRKYKLDSKGSEAG